ncbi:hypothetical protein H0901_13205 [Microcystis aeruginosa BLCCF158]|uniref:Uncharacterized protein n=1 Tax=Microcystis aeruginosa BLCC-F158 TaxID=2755316 RepID=A0A841V613_MICAE|nr:hypothetical protein [Microcystis aeruginosa]MBC1196187.1 hypothetical protein [Microcystis aeruginosa BLCC-F158]
MLKSDWIKLINAIRLRKINYQGKDGEFSYRFFYQQISDSRRHLEEEKNIPFTLQKSGLEFSGKNITFWLTCFYNYEIPTALNQQETYQFEQVLKKSIDDIFSDRICTGQSDSKLTTSFNSSYGTDNFFYHAGFYAAAFLYAFDVKEPKMQLIDQQWIVIDEKLGYLDFATYFSYPKAIPIKLPIPKIIDLKTTSNFQLAEGVEINDLKTTSNFQLAEGVEINDQDHTNYQQASQYLDEIRKEIKDGLLDQ